MASIAEKNDGISDGQVFDLARRAVEHRTRPEHVGRDHLLRGRFGVYVGTRMPPAQGIIRLVTSSAAHVQWSTGTRKDQMDLVDLRDIMPILSPQALARINPTSTTAVRQVHDAEGVAGVLMFIANTRKLSQWMDIAAAALAVAEAGIRKSAVMDIVYEQLTADEAEEVVRHASRVLLRDAFGTLPEDA
jgi:hypothetical protein